MSDNYGYVELAKKTIREYIKNKNKIDPPTDKEGFDKKAGVFVSIKKNNQLRGCIGTIEPKAKDIGHEIVENAISASTKDPRFNSIKEDELDDLNLSVDVLGPKEKVEDISKLNPKKYGVIVKRGFKVGLLLPNLEGIDTVDQQLDIALRKAGIYPDEEYEIMRFKVERYE
ncbi:MAG: AmmeMemoRadiSam system protein A [Halanaerobiales bacterium]|nr:AmmeMemoRadiSam system protein A [Halanaerobiales bacterium]